MTPSLTFFLYFQQILPALWLTLITGLILFPSGLNTPVFYLFFFMQAISSWPQFRLNSPLRMKVMAGTILVFTLLSLFHYDGIKTGLIGLLLSAETLILLKLAGAGTLPDWLNLTGTVFLVLINLIFPQPQILRYSLLLGIAILLRQIQLLFLGGKNTEFDQEQLRLLKQISCVHLTLVLLNRPICSGLVILIGFLTKLFSTLLLSLIHLFGFLFSSLILAIQSLLQWALSHQSLSQSPNATMIPENTVNPAPDPGNIISGSSDKFFQILMILVILLLVLLLIRTLNQTMKNHSAADFDLFTESSNSVHPVPVQSSLRKKLQNWIHPEKDSWIRKEYRNAVNLRIRRGMQHAPSATPDEYLNLIQNEKPDPDFAELTEAYKKERYRP